MESDILGHSASSFCLGVHSCAKVHISHTTHTSHLLYIHIYFLLMCHMRRNYYAHFTVEEIKIMETLSNSTKLFPTHFPKHPETDFFLISWE